MKPVLQESLQGLSSRIVEVEAKLLRDALRRMHVYGLERLDLAQMVSDLGVKKAARQVIIFNNVIRDSQRVGLIELGVALLVRRVWVRKFRVRRWLDMNVRPVG